ncbi:ATP-binding cassette domain-containing protein [Pseudonocardia acidicola]|uniref:ATP-binding cassette domain-containing protein n=1 Tax=Pseudonocardia acidicola TaxID=2724939 RepID=A0ABX1SF69_9PSEU|nr:ATP-binding cassette domain-containing protein [Pseudonocardia acidicola]NMH99138.1 ATP-binding cassette domain-containing protein [Pseudonocardia acidicola]
MPEPDPEPAAGEDTFGARAAPPVPALRTEGLGLRTRHGWVFTDVTVELPAGGLLSVHGPAGSGRSMLLLALAGRAATTAGRLTVDGAERPAAIRRRVAVARIGGAVDLEPGLRVADHIRERRLLTGAPVTDLDEAVAVLGLTLPRTDRVGDLLAVDAVLFAVALATMGRPALIVVDDVEAGLPAADRDRVIGALFRLTDSGIAVATAGVDPVAAADAVVALDGAAAELGSVHGWQERG